jgi:hypothetical protein
MIGWCGALIKLCVIKNAIGYDGSIVGLLNLLRFIL